MKNIPNILTFTRMIVIPALVFSLYSSTSLGNWLAFIIFVLAGITDYFDGLLARNYQATSKLGQFLDPVADKLLVASVILMLTAFNVINGFHIIAALIILMREILVSGLREFLSTVQVSVPGTQLAKWKTAIQMIALGALLIGNSAPVWLPTLQIGLTLLWIAALLTLYTGYDYLRAGLKHL